MAHSTNGRPPQLAHRQRNSLIQMEVFRCRHVPKCKRSKSQGDRVSLGHTAHATQNNNNGWSMWHARPRSPRATPSHSQKTTTWTRSSEPAESRCDTPGRRARRPEEDHSRVTAEKGHARTRVTLTKRRFPKYKPNSKISGKVQGATHCPVAGPSISLNAHVAVPLSQEVPFGRSLHFPFPARLWSRLRGGGFQTSSPHSPRGGDARTPDLPKDSATGGERVFRPDAHTSPLKPPNF